MSQNLDELLQKLNSQKEDPPKTSPDDLANWPELGQLGKMLKKESVEMKTFTVRFDNAGEYDDEEIEATRFINDGGFVIFYNDRNEKVFTLPVSRLIYIKSEE